MNLADGISLWYSRAAREDGDNVHSMHIYKNIVHYKMHEDDS